MPEGATVLEPVGTAPGVVVPPRDGGAGPTVVVLPGPPRELQPMWAAARADRRVPRPRSPARPTTSRRSCGCSGSPSPRSPRRCASPSSGARPRRRWRSRPACAAARSRSRRCYEPGARGRLRGVRRAHRASATATRCSPRTARRSTSRSRRCWRAAARTIAVAESCTGGLLAARLTERPGSSAYVLRRRRRRTRTRRRRRWRASTPALIERYGAVSAEVADALADGALGALRRRRRRRRDRHRRARAAARRRSRSGACARGGRGRATARAIARRLDLPGGRAGRARPHDDGRACTCCGALLRGEVDDAGVSGRAGRRDRRGCSSRSTCPSRSSRRSSRGARRCCASVDALRAGRAARRCTSRSCFLGCEAGGGDRAAVGAGRGVRGRAPAASLGSRSASRCGCRAGARACSRVALEDRHGQLGALQARLVERAGAGGWHEPEARPFLPHVTVARVRARRAVPRARAARRRRRSRSTARPHALPLAPASGGRALRAAVASADSPERCAEAVLRRRRCGSYHRRSARTDVRPRSVRRQAYRRCPHVSRRSHR